MLALTRKEGRKIFLIVNEGTPEEVKIGVSVVRVSRGHAKLGFEAPPNVSIIREELYQEGKNGKIV